MDKLLLLGIDWQAIVAYVINYGIIFFIVGKFLVPKLLQFLDERRGTIENSVNEANLLKKEFEEKLAAIEKEKQEAHLAMLAEIDKMKKIMEEKQADLMQKLDYERSVMLEKANQEIETRKKTLIKDAESRMLELVKKIVLYIVQNKVPGEVINQSVQDAWRQYKV